MSEKWQMYLRQDEAGDLYIMADVGIHGEIDALAPADLLRLDLPVSSADGYPDDAQDAALNAIEDQLHPGIEALGGLYVGRITRPGMRSLFYYASLNDAQADALVRDAEVRSGLKIGSYLGADPEHLVYKHMLYPTPEEWSLIRDFGVFEQLGENGDERDQPRQVRHFAYFPDQAGAESFAVYVQSAGYTVDKVGTGIPGKPAKSYSVLFSRQDTPAYGDFTAANVELRKAAERCGGEYDGWESEIVRTLQ